MSQKKRRYRTPTFSSALLRRHFGPLTKDRDAPASRLGFTREACRKLTALYLPINRAHKFRLMIDFQKLMQNFQADIDTLLSARNGGLQC